MENEKRCEALKDDGTRCKNTHTLEATESGLRCVWHDPARLVARRAMQAKGGRRKPPVRAALPENDLPPIPETAADAALWSAMLVQWVATGALDPARAGQINQSLKVFLSAISRADLERRIKELERTYKRLEGE